MMKDTNPIYPAQFYWPGKGRGNMTVMTGWDNRFAARPISQPTIGGLTIGRQLTSRPTRKDPPTVCPAWKLRTTTTERPYA